MALWGPPFLVPKSGLDIGHFRPQIVANADDSESLRQSSRSAALTGCTYVPCSYRELKRTYGTSYHALHNVRTPLHVWSENLWSENGGSHILNSTDTTTQLSTLFRIKSLHIDLLRVIEHGKEA